MFRQEVRESLGNWVTVFPFGETSYANVSFQVSSTLGNINVDTTGMLPLADQIERVETILAALKQAKDYIDKQNPILQSDKHEFENGHPDDDNIFDSKELNKGTNGGELLIDKEFEDENRDDQNWIHDSDMGAKG